MVPHADAYHLPPGCASYLVVRDGLLVTHTRLGVEASIQTAAYGESITLSGLGLSLHPARHILGSAQVRLTYCGEVAVVSGDYWPGPSLICAPFDPMRCHTLVAEATLGLPIFRWKADDAVFGGINAWRQTNRDSGRASLLFGDALGKAQRLLAGVDLPIGSLYTPGAVERLVAAYRTSGVALPLTRPVAEERPDRAVP